MAGYGDGTYGSGNYDGSAGGTNPNSTYGLATYGSSAYGVTSGTTTALTFTAAAGSQTSISKKVMKSILVNVTPLTRSPGCTFSRGTTAYKSDGSQVSGNNPRFETGRNGKAIFIEEGTTNLLQGMNPDLSVWSSGVPSHWAISSTGGGTFSVTQETGIVHFSSSSAKVVASATEVILSCGQQGTNLTLDLSGTYTGTIWVYLTQYLAGTDNNPHVMLQRTDTSAVLAGASIDTTILNQWQAVEVTYSGGSSGIVPAALVFNTRTNASGLMTCYIAGGQVE